MQVGVALGNWVGVGETDGVGEALGEAGDDGVGVIEGERVGVEEKLAVGDAELDTVGDAEMDTVGDAESATVGDAEGEAVGEAECVADGDAERDAVGETERVTDGDGERDAVGVADRLGLVLAVALGVGVALGKRPVLKRRRTLRAHSPTACHSRGPTRHSPHPPRPSTSTPKASTMARATCSGTAPPSTWRLSSAAMSWDSREAVRSSVRVPSCGWASTHRLRRRRQYIAPHPSRGVASPGTDGTKRGQGVPCAAEWVLQWSGLKGGPGPTTVHRRVATGSGARSPSSCKNTRALHLPAPPPGHAGSHARSFSTVATAGIFPPSTPTGSEGQRTTPSRIAVADTTASAIKTTWHDRHQTRRMSISVIAVLPTANILKNDTCGKSFFPRPSMPSLGFDLFSPEQHEQTQVRSEEWGRNRARPPTALRVGCLAHRLSFELKKTKRRDVRDRSRCL